MWKNCVSFLNKLIKYEDFFHQISRGAKPTHEINQKNLVGLMKYIDVKPRNKLIIERNPSSTSTSLSHLFCGVLSIYRDCEACASLFDRHLCVHKPKRIMRLR